MNNIVNSVYKSLKDENWYAALFVSLSLPDICCALEFGETCGDKYSAWFESNLPQYSGFLPGDDCYALRCALLHLGKEDITDQRKMKILEHFKFRIKKPHLTLVQDSSFGGGKNETFLVLVVQEFCEDICKAVEKWLEEKSKKPTIQDRLKEMIEIHEGDYTYKGAIKFQND